MDRLEMFKALMVMAAADGRFSNEEVELLALRSHCWGLTDPQFSEALECAKNGTESLRLPEEDGARHRLLQELLEVKAADGELAPLEKKLYAVAAAAMGLSAEDLDRNIDEWM